MGGIKEEMASNGGAAGEIKTPHAARKLKPQDIKSPTGFESSPKPNMYTKTMKFKIVSPKDRINSVDLWSPKKGQPKFDNFPQSKGIYKEIKINRPAKFYLGLNDIGNFTELIRTSNNYDDLQTLISDLNKEWKVPTNIEFYYDGDSSTFNNTIKYIYISEDNEVYFKDRNGDSFIPEKFGVTRWSTDYKQIFGLTEMTHEMAVPPQDIQVIDILTKLNKQTSQLFSIPVAEWNQANYDEWNDILYNATNKPIDTSLNIHEIKINKPISVPKYKQKVLEWIEWLKDEGGGNSNISFYDTMSSSISNLSTVEDIDITIYEDFFFGEDDEGFKEWKQEIKSKLNEVKMKPTKFRISEIKINKPSEDIIGDEININEVRYSKFKKNTSKRTPQEQLHMAVKEIQMNLDKVNKLVEFTHKMKAELKEVDGDMTYLSRTRNSLAKIQEKIQQISNKFKAIIE